MKAFFLAFFSTAMVALAQTKQSYITEKVSTNYEPFKTVTNRPVSENSPLPSSSTKDDPEGNWGQVYGGLQLSIRLEKATFTNQEPITASVLFRNVTDKPIKFIFFYPLDHALKLIVQKENESIMGSGKEPISYETIEELHSRRLTGKLWRETIPAGRQREFVIGLTNFYNLSSGNYRIHAQQEVINSGQTKEAHVASGFATFDIVSALGNQK